MKLFGFNFLTPLWLFCILLATLVIACVFGNCQTFEGMNNLYNVSSKKKTMLDTFSITPYTNNNNIRKMYDNTFWDDTTGAVVRVFEKNNTAHTPYLYIVNNRDGSSVTNEWNVNYRNTKIITNLKLDSKFSIDNTDIASATHKRDLAIDGVPSSNTQLFYMPFERSTYIHVIDKFAEGNAIHKFTAYMGNSKVTGFNGRWWATKGDWINSDVTTGTYYNNINVITLKSYVDPTSELDTKRYVKIISGMYYDISSGWIKAYTTDASAEWIKRNDGSISATAPTIAEPTDLSYSNSPSDTANPFTPIVLHSANRFIVMIPFKTTTFISVMDRNDGTSPWKYANLTNNPVRFNIAGIASPVADAVTPQDPSGNDASGNDTSSDDDDDDDDSSDDASGNNTDISGNDDFWKWYWYWKTEGGSDMSSDYILKTQVVPPVCPTCPRCPHGGGACTNCGGQGGSGTVGQAGSTLVGGGITGSVNNAVNTTGNLIGSVGTGITNTATNAVVGGTLLGAGAINTAGGLGGKVLDSGTGLARDTLGLARDTVSGTAGLAKDAVSGTAGLARDAVSGTVGLAKDTVSGTVGLAKDVVSGTTGLLSNQQGSYNQGSQSQQTNINSYSYNGTLPSRGSTNFMPVTADFSRFGR